MSRKNVNQNNNPNDNTINLDENNITAMNLKQSSNLGLNKSQNTKLTPEKNKKKEEEEDDANEALKKNLMFNQRNISPIKLYCHLSSSTEILLMFFGIIGSCGAGIAGPLMSYLFGDMINSFTSTQSLSESGEVQYQYYYIFMNEFQKTIDKMVKKFLYIGTGMFVANFLSQFNKNKDGLMKIMLMNLLLKYKHN